MKFIIRRIKRDSDHVFWTIDKPLLNARKEMIPGGTSDWIVDINGIRQLLKLIHSKFQRLTIEKVYSPLPVKEQLFRITIDEPEPRNRKFGGKR